jgi:archaellum component FlaF (FlaF/FlaG flagellin family)
MKKIVFAFIAATSMLSISAQVKYAKLYYKNTLVETNEVTLSVDNAVSTDVETKFKLKITNKTNDFIMFKPDECKFIINGKEIKPTEKPKTIEPNSSDWLIVNIKGGGYNSIKNYSFEIGGLYKVSTTGKVFETPDFKLPASKNDFKTGNYNLVLTKLVKESGKTEAKFDCSYNGDKVGVFFPSRMAVKMPDGNEYATLKPSGILAKKGPIVLTKGQTESFSGNWEKMAGGKTMDMQKVDMQIKWNETFTEVDPEKLKNETLNLEFDEATSNEKGK